MLEKLRDLISNQCNCDAESVDPSARFKEDLEADSLDLFELIMALEDAFGVEIPAQDLENLLTVQDVMDYLSAKGIE